MKSYFLFLNKIGQKTSFWIIYDRKPLSKVGIATITINTDCFSLKWFLVKWGELTKLKLIAHYNCWIFYCTKVTKEENWTDKNRPVLRKCRIHKSLFNLVVHCLLIVFQFPCQCMVVSNWTVCILLTREIMSLGSKEETEF